MGKLDDAGGLIARNEDIIVRRAFVRYRSIREFLAPHGIGPTAKKLGWLRRQQVRAERDLWRLRAKHTLEITRLIGVNLAADVGQKARRIGIRRVLGSFQQ